MNDRSFQIEGMSCDDCARTIERQLGALPGVASVSASFPTKRAIVEAPASVTDAMILAALGEKGYRGVPGGTPSGGPTKAFASGGDPTRFDLVVVGSGGAAFGAVLRAAELGARVAMVERGTLGGTCVNIGCVPSKTLIRAAEALHRAQRTPFAGLSVGGRLADFGQLMAQKDALVGDLREHKYAEVLASLPGAQLIRGQGEFVERGTLQVGSVRLQSDRFIVATGARPHAAAIPGLAETGALDSSSALALTELPESLIVIGGRYIALELAQAFARLGTKVTLVQRSSHLLPTEDDDVTEALAGFLRDEGIRILTGCQTRRVRRDGAGFAVDVEIGDEPQTLHAAQLLVATGRRPNSDGMGLDRIGVTLAPDGTIAVDDLLATSAPGVFAAGDVVGEPAFVYTAAYEGRLAAENALSGAGRRRDYTALPWVMFTDPQVAVVGLNEKRALAAGLAVDVSKLPLSYVPRSLAARDTRGFLKLVKERGGDRLLGASLLAPEAGDLIMEPALAIRHGIGVSTARERLSPVPHAIGGHQARRADLLQGCLEALLLRLLRRGLVHGSQAAAVGPRGSNARRTRCSGG